MNDWSATCTIPESVRIDTGKSYLVHHLSEGSL